MIFCAVILSDLETCKIAGKLNNYWFCSSKLSAMWRPNCGSRRFTQRMSAFKIVAFIYAASQRIAKSFVYLHRKRKTRRLNGSLGSWTKYS